LLNFSDFNSAEKPRRLPIFEKITDKSKNFENLLSYEPITQVGNDLVTYEDFLSLFPAPQWIKD